MSALNAAVAEQLIAFKKETDALIEKGVKKDEAIFQVLRKYIIESRPVRFRGERLQQGMAGRGCPSGIVHGGGLYPGFKGLLLGEGQAVVRGQRDIE